VEPLWPKFPEEYRIVDGRYAPCLNFFVLGKSRKLKERPPPTMGLNIFALLSVLIEGMLIAVNQI